MILKILGSSSSGNCYILESDTEALVIEAGIKFKDVKKAINYKTSKIVGVIVSHIHSDHAKYINEYEICGIPTFNPYLSEMERQVRTYGGFVIKSFPLVHDVPCYGFLVSHPDMGKLVYITDTEYCKFKFSNLNHILIEANHDRNMLDATKVQYEHQITGHMEIGTTLNFLEANRSPALRNVVLLHLSDGYSSEDEFIRRANGVVDCSCYAADKGMNIELREFPF